MDRHTELGLERRCRLCREWWPLDGTFYKVMSRNPGRRLVTCNACRAARRSEDRRIYVLTDIQLAKKRERERARYHRLREDPAWLARKREQNRLTAARYYERHAEAVREARRERYAQERGGNVRIGFGRRRLAA